MEATTLNQVVCSKSPVLNEIAELIADTADCAIESPKLEYVIPSVEDCHWMFPILPAAKDKLTLFP